MCLSDVVTARGNSPFLGMSLSLELLDFCPLLHLVTFFKKNVGPAIGNKCSAGWVLWLFAVASIKLVFSLNGWKAVWCCVERGTKHLSSLLTRLNKNKLMYSLMSRRDFIFLSEFRGVASKGHQPVVCCLTFFCSTGCVRINWQQKHSNLREWVSEWEAWVNVWPEISSEWS